MKNIPRCLTLILLLCCATAEAQQIRSGITASPLTAQVNAGNLDLMFDMTASGIDIRCGGERILEFTLRNAGHRLVLPAVIYSGSLRYRYEQRRRLLSGSSSATPYHIYKGVKKKHSYTLEYRLSIPFEEWMAGAELVGREYTRDCSGYRHTGRDIVFAVLPARATTPPPVVVQPEAIPVSKPDPALFARLVHFRIPETEEIKMRASAVELHIGFPVNTIDVLPDFGDNRRELARADSLVRMLENDERLTINTINIRGYASPDGSYERNERLAQGRSLRFHQYLTNRYPGNLPIRYAVIGSVAEDWEGLIRMLEDSYIPGKRQALSIATDRSLLPDDKDARLKEIVRWSDNYGVIFRQMYPRLRRIELRVEYTVQNFNDDLARELIFTAPQMLSLDEMVRVARYQEPGSEAYRRVYEIAARYYPDDPVANHNAAAALLQQGYADAAWPYLNKAGEGPDAYLNLGTYWYIKGDTDRAAGYFDQAHRAGLEQGRLNLMIIRPER